MLQTFDERNRDLLININGELKHRDEAGISPFDSLAQGGDAVWEGLRLYDLTLRRGLRKGWSAFVHSTEIRVFVGLLLGSIAVISPL